jgi:Calcineurin-like phosphoesterase
MKPPTANAKLIRGTMMGYRFSSALLLPGILLGLQAGVLFAAAREAALPTSRFEFAIIGDVPYNAQEEAKFPDLMAAIDRTNVVFVVHNGDFKSGSSPCTDALFAQRYKQFQTFKHPFIYIFGDNEWADCHRSGFDALERLAKLREIFTQEDTSLGRSPIPLTRQSANPQFGKFRENIRWRVGSVLFIGLNIPGSNNNFPTTLRTGASVGNLEEYTERNAATLTWMRQSFALANQDDSPSIMLFVQGNPFPFTPSDSSLDGFEEFVVALEEESLKFGKPVVLAHGDSHYFRVDKPLPRPDADGYRRPRLVNFTRVENFGSPDVHWVRGTFDPHDPALFSFKPELLP